MVRIFQHWSDDVVGDFAVEVDEGQTIVDLYATWCKPCHVLARTLDQMEGDLNIHGIDVIKVDIDQYPEIKEKYQVNALPTIVYLLNGEERGRVVGAKTQGQIKQELGLDFD